MPVFACKECLLPLYERIRSTLEPLGCEYELIFVEDGGEDGSWELLKNLAQKNASVRAFKHKRNYGQHAAISTGLSSARGEFALLMDADLQDPPELIPRFLEAARAGKQIVLSVRTARSASFIRRLGSTVLRKLFPLYSRFPNGYYYGSFVLISREIVAAYLQQPDRFCFSIKVLDRLPGKLAFLHYDQQTRYAGPSSYSLYKVFVFCCRAVGPQYWTAATAACLAVMLMSFLGMLISCQGNQQATIVNVLFAGITSLTFIAIFFCIWAYEQARNVKKEICIELEESIEQSNREGTAACRN